MPPTEKNANESQIAASATFTVLKKVAFGFRTCAKPNSTARISIAGTAPIASARRRSGTRGTSAPRPAPRAPNPSASGPITRGHTLQSPVSRTVARSDDEGEPDRQHRHERAEADAAQQPRHETARLACASPCVPKSTVEEAAHNDGRREEADDFERAAAQKRTTAARPRPGTNSAMPIVMPTPIAA